jgi:Cdc6-like AAA superfamily ATPase
MSETDLLSSIHKALIGFDKRAERNSDEILEATFVDSAPLFDLLATKNSQVIYGRRGTGKTHTLKYLARHVEKTNERPIYIDLRYVGSNGSIYSDGSRPLAERASTLILDVLNAINGELYVLAVEALDKAPDPDQITLRLTISPTQYKASESPAQLRQKTEEKILGRKTIRLA